MTRPHDRGEQDDENVAKPEEIAPWAVTEAANREPYPRKNLYFVGPGQDEVYDYCIWRANIDGYETLEGVPARSSSELIGDLLRRMYLRDMLDQKKADDFSAWRARQYERRGFAAELAAPFLPGKYLMRQKVSQSRNQDPRFRAFVRPRQKVDSETRIAIWEAQNGSCAHCGAKRALQLVEAPNPYSSSADAVDEAEGGAAVEKFVALCNQCTMRNKAVSPSAHQS